MAHVLAEVAGAIATVTLDHERRRDALGRALAKEPVAAVPAFRGAKALVVVLRSRLINEAVERYGPRPGARR